MRIALRHIGFQGWPVWRGSLISRGWFECNESYLSFHCETQPTLLVCLDPLEQFPCLAWLVTALPAFRIEPGTQPANASSWRPVSPDPFPSATCLLWGGGETEATYADLNIFAFKVTKNNNIYYAPSPCDVGETWRNRIDVIDDLLIASLRRHSVIQSSS